MRNLKQRVGVALAMLLASAGVVVAPTLPASAGSVPISKPGATAEKPPKTPKLSKADQAKARKAKANAVTGQNTRKDAHFGPKDRRGAQTRATNCVPDCHLYAGAYQYISSPDAITAFTMRQEVGDPTVRAWDAAVDGFSLMQNAVQDTASGNFVEAGWVVQGPFSDDKPRFFTSAWNPNHVGWGTSFVPFPGSALVYGQDLSSWVGDGVGFRLSWQYQDNTACSGCAGWWLYWNKAVGDPLGAVGYYPDSVFSGNGGFTAADVDLVQGFGEIVCDQLPCQTGMGEDSLLAANMTKTSAYALSGSSAPAESWSKAVSTDAEKWDANVTSGTAWEFGGPGGWDRIEGGPDATADDCSGTGTSTNPSGLGAVCLYDTWTTPSITPQDKKYQIDMIANTTCRVLTAGNGVSMVVLTGVKTATVYTTNNCTGTGYTANHGRVGLAAPYSNAVLSYRVNNAYATCATGWPTTKPTC